MANENDKTILTLKKQIAQKKSALKVSERFSPITNCSIELDGIRSNIQVLTKDQLVTLLVKLNSYKMSAKELGILADYFISGFCVEDWIKDVQAKLMNVNRKVEEFRLKTLEDKLDNLLSNEKKVELELDEIASSLL
jgi:hypothetical protein